MPREIVTNYVFFDTSVFITENFFAGRKLQAFLKHQARGEIKLLTTNITVKEAVRNLDENLDDSHSAFKRCLRDLDTKAKTFKNIASLNDFFWLKENFSFSEERDQLIAKFKEQVSKHFQTIPIQSDFTALIIDDYFDSNPPFDVNKKEKKSEFPDAFVLHSLAAWAKNNKSLVYVVSTDGDMQNFESDYLINVKEYEELLTDISYTFSDKNIEEKINKVIEEKEKEIIAETRTLFEENFPSSGFDLSQGFEYETNGMEKFEAYVESHNVLYIEDDSAAIELIVPVEYAVDTEYEDTSMGWYDREDERWYGTESHRINIYGECQLVVAGIIELVLPGKNMFDRVWVEEITSGIPKNLSID